MELKKASVPVKGVVPVEGLAKPKGVWSVAIRANPGELVFVSGLLSKNEAGEIVEVGGSCGK
jgi:hypothetical protein